MTTRWIVKSVLILSTVVVTSCSSLGSSGSVVQPSAPSSTFAMPELEFGRGSLPPSIPLSFPIPESAVVGATMMAGSRNLTEVVVTYPSDVDAVAGFYTTNLPASGYQVVESVGMAGTRTIAFSGVSLSGEIRLDPVASGITTGTLSFAHR